jgi:phosphomannomutase
MLMLELALPGDTKPSGNMIAVRPSGTEPKVKFYLFGVEPVATTASLAQSQRIVSDRIDRMKTDARRLA